MFLTTEKFLVTFLFPISPVKSLLPISVFFIGIELKPIQGHNIRPR